MAKILVLDDLDDAAQLVKRILEDTGHEVFAFTEEEAALQFVQVHPVDLAILDIKLKKMTGLEVLARLKKMAPSVRALMLTGYPTIQSAQESLKLGACEYCEKPIDNDELVQKVAAALTAVD